MARCAPMACSRRTRIQAKCASKYEGKPNYKVPRRPTRIAPRCRLENYSMENLGALAIILAFCFSIYSIAGGRGWQMEIEAIPDRQR